MLIQNLPQGFVAHKLGISHETAKQKQQKKASSRTPFSAYADYQIVAFFIFPNDANSDNAANKREESDARINYSEREQGRSTKLGQQ